MSALIIGGDRVNTYRDYLSSKGFTEIRHWTGRKNSECHRTLPQDTELIVVLVDFVNHGLARKIRRIANEREVPVIFSRRSIGQLESQIRPLAS